MDLTDMLIKNADRFFQSCIEYVFRRRSPGLALLRIAAGLMVPLLGGWIISASIPLSTGRLKFSVSPADIPSLVFTIAWAVVVVLVVVGVWMVINDELRLRRKKVVAIELRGLRDMSGTPLERAIPMRIIGRREPLLIDIRQGADGQILQPRDIIRRIEALPARLSYSEAGFDRQDVTIVAAALAAVPFTFLYGVLLDDESNVELMDWDRNIEAWRSLTDADDGKRFVTTGLEKFTPTSDVVLSVSVSYKTDGAAIVATFPTFPKIEMVLQDGSTDAHWSVDKQVALTRQFFDTVRYLGDLGVKRIHLILAGPASVVTRFGRSYDKRNLPLLFVYQYDKGKDIVYPWAVSMPVSGKSAAEIIHMVPNQGVVSN